MKKTLFALALIAALPLSVQADEPDSPYPPVHITNSTNYNLYGTVSYLSIFCSDDEFSIKPNEAWRASDRGMCLVKEIEATVRSSLGDIPATSYFSNGTSHSEFAIIALSNAYETLPIAFEVTRKD